MISGEVIKKVVRKSDGVALWTAGSTVTYYVDTNVYYTEEVDNGASCLSPKEFTPSKDGWTFVGWREDTTASGSVVDSKVMDSDPITLYAVYEKTITANFYSGWYPDTRVLDTPTGKAYYNASGDIQNAQITAPKGTGISGWTWRGWSNWYDGTANGDVNLNNEDTFYVHPDNDGITLLGLYQKTITAHFISGIGGTSDQPVEGTAYYNSAGNVSTIDITAPSGKTETGWTWRGWSKYWDQAAVADVYLEKDDTTTINHENDGITYYGLYQQTITEKFIDYDGSKNNENPQYATTYYNSAGNTSYSNITVPNAAEWSGMTFEGWSYPGSNSFDVNVTKDQVLQSTADCTRYAIYTKTVYLYYNGNGASSGSVTTQSGTVRCNVVGNWSYPSFRLAENGFTKSGYTFNGWNLGVVGASITLSANATAYAQWVGTPYYPTFTSSSLWTKVGTVDNAATPFKAYDSSVEVCAQDNGQMTDFSYSTYQATFNTQGCNKVRLYVKEESGGRGVGSGEARVISNSGTISQGITTEGKHYLYFDMSGDTFTVQLSVGNASTYYSISVYLYEIYAYCE